MKPVTNETVLQQLRWRYATKKFDAARRVSDTDWRTLEEVLVLTPSSFGLQPWKFIVITDPATRQKLVPVSWGQTQLVEASHVVVFAVRKSLGAADVDEYVRSMASTRGVPVESLEGFRKVLLGFLEQLTTAGGVAAWATRQAYIALGNLMTSASLLGLDTCPMEGLDPAAYDRVLGLDKTDYATVMACPVGYRAGDDKYAALPKVRFAADRVIQHIG